MTGQPLHQSVEDLTAAGYLVLGPENAEEAAVLLGVLAFADEPRGTLETRSFRWRAETLLAAFPAVAEPTGEPNGG